MPLPRLHGPLKGRASLLTALWKKITADTKPGVGRSDPPTLLNIPLEIRYHILGYLISNKTITPPSAYEDEDLTRPYDQPNNILNIFLVNHQLYNEAFTHLYRNNSAIILVRLHVVDFLQRCSSCTDLVVAYPYHGGYLGTCRDSLPDGFPYEAFKEITVEVNPIRKDNTDALGLRWGLFMFCRTTVKRNFHFRKLRITFVETEEDRDEGLGWDRLWEYSQHPGDKAYEALLRKNRKAELIPYENPSCLSTFSWLLSIFALCPGVADECVIELPSSLKGYADMEETAKQYEEILDGRTPVDEEDEDFLENDNHTLHHKHGNRYCDDDNCKKCIRESEQEEKSNRERYALDLAVFRLNHVYDLEDATVSPGTEIWEPQYRWDYVAEPYTACERQRKRIMKAMDTIFGSKWGRKLYLVVFWAMNVLGRGYSKEEIKDWEATLGDVKVEWMKADWDGSYRCSEHTKRERERLKSNELMEWIQCFYKRRPKGQR